MLLLYLEDVVESVDIPLYLQLLYRAELKITSPVQSDASEYVLRLDIRTIWGGRPAKTTRGRI